MPALVEWPWPLAACERVKEDVGETDVRCKCDPHTIPHPPTHNSDRRPNVVSSLNKQLDPGLNTCIHRRICLPQGLFGRARHDRLITYCLLPRTKLYSPRDQHPVPAIIDLLPPRCPKTHPTPAHLQTGDPCLAKQRQVHLRSWFEITESRYGVRF